MTIKLTGEVVRPADSGSNSDLPWACRGLPRARSSSSPILFGLTPGAWKRPRGVEGCRGALAPPCKRVRQPAAPRRLVFVPTLRSIKLVIKQSHRCDLTAGPTRRPTRITRRVIFPGRAARGSVPPRKAICQVSGERVASIVPRSPARVFAMGKAPGSCCIAGAPRPGRQGLYPRGRSRPNNGFTGS